MLRVGHAKIMVQSWQEKEGHFLSKVPRPALGPTQPPIQWVEGDLPGASVSTAFLLSRSLYAADNNSVYVECRQNSDGEISYVKVAWEM